MKEFKEWSRKRKEIVTEENYSSKESFNKTVADFLEPVKVKELNPVLTEIGQLGDIVEGKKDGFFYARTNHANYAELESRLKNIEVGRLSHPEYFSSCVFPSGMAAITAALESLANSNGVFLRGDVVYVSTKEILSDQGDGKTRFGTKATEGIDMTKPNNLERVLRQYKKNNQEGIPDSKVLGIIVETVANPTIKYTDIREISKIAHKYDVPLIVDNTFLTPYLFEPFRAGADMVIHSLTKYFSGEGDMMGGVVTTPNEFASRIKNIRKNKGAVMSPNEAYEFSKRAKGVGARIEKHSINAAYIASVLEQTKGINVMYNHLKDNTREGQAGGVLSFTFKGDENTAFNRSLKFTQYLIDNPGVVRQAVSLAEPQTLVLPWGGQVGSIERMRKYNLDSSLVRIAAGREQDIKPVTQYIKTAVEKSL